MLTPDKHLSRTAATLFELVKSLPIVSPHGHCDPKWWAKDQPFPDPASLLITPDHYVFRMLYSQGVSMTELGFGVPERDRDARAIFEKLAQNWHCFLGTPSREWLEHTLYYTLGVKTELAAKTSNIVFDEITEKLSQPDFRPRALFDTFNIEVLSTTDPAIGTLEHHTAINKSRWKGRIVPTFRPDSVLNPVHPSFLNDLAILSEITGEDTRNYSGYLTALRARRTFFRTLGATATDHDVPTLATEWLDRREIEQLHSKAMADTLNSDDALRYYGHMLVEMAQMSVEDGMVMQLHVGSERSTNQALLKTWGPDMGADIPKPVNWVCGLQKLLDRVGNEPNLRVILFTLDESTYSRQLAPMAGHWPCLRIGPPWWFHDSANGMRRYLDRVVETAGYFNLAGFNDDTRAFLSIPARHNTWRRAVSIHLGDQVDNGRVGQSDAEMLAPMLCRDMALSAYRLNEESQ